MPVLSDSSQAQKSKLPIRQDKGSHSVSLLPEEAEAGGVTQLVKVLAVKSKTYV